MKKFILLVIVLGILGYVFLWDKKTEPEKAILSFKDCADAGYLVMESYPRQCRTPDGRTFAEEITPPITYIKATADMIKVENPGPGAVTGKEFIVTGEARGNWYFEASFPLKVLDKDGKLLAQTYATAQGEWMTTEFVPFKSELIKIPASYIGPATLVLEKDNASGLPEHDASISFPITIEY